VELRRARPDDADAVADVYLASFATLTFLPHLHTDDETRAWIAEHVLPQHEVWVAKTDAGVVGMAVLSERVLEHLYVAPDAQNRGVGSALLAKAKERRPTGFTLWTFQANESARRFYERHGFRALQFTDGEGNEEKTPDVQYGWP